MSEEQAEPRRLTPFMKLSEPGPTFKDLTPHVVEADDEKKEVEDTITPAPKDLSAQESVISSESVTVQQKSETHALPDEVLPTEKLEAAVRENGKDNSENEEDQPTPTTTTPESESSSPSSSSPTSPGKPLPPVVAKPPTGG